MSNIYGNMLNSVITGCVQLPSEEFNNPAVLAFNEIEPAHLYMICTRPKITITEIYHENDSQEYVLNFSFDGGGSKTQELVTITSPQTEHIELEYPYTTITVITKEKERDLWSTSILYQTIAKELIPPDVPPTLYHLDTINFNPNLYPQIKNTDLKVQYVGKSFGTDGSRVALDRLKNHKALQEILSKTISKEPYLEVWVLLLPLAPLSHTNVLFPYRGESDEENSKQIDEFLNIQKNPPFIDLNTRINFTEAALINYFKPAFNVNFKKIFPHIAHNSYKDCFNLPIDFFAFELQTQASIGCRIFSDTIKPNYLHFKDHKFNSTIDRETFFDMDDV